MKNRIHFLAAFGALAILQPALAQDKAARTVSRDELRVCMNSESDLAGRRKALHERATASREEQKSIAAEAEELGKERQRLEDEQKSMDRFERKVRQHNGRVKTANEQSTALRAELETLNKELVAYNDKCGGIAFRPEDKEAILKEREAAKK